LGTGINDAWAQRVGRQAGNSLIGQQVRHGPNAPDLGGAGQALTGCSEKYL
jgi:hypothetical protein